MTWFSSGLNNLKEQFNSLIHDDEENENNIQKQAESAPPLTSAEDTSIVSSSQPSNQSADLTEQAAENSKEKQFPFAYRHEVIKYSKTLGDLLNDVNFLHSSLNEVVGSVARYIDENELLRHYEEGRGSDVLAETTIMDSVAPITNAGIYDETEFGKACESWRNQRTTNSSRLSGEMRDCGKNSTTSKETQTVCDDEERQRIRPGLPKDTELAEFTDQIENLITETDDITENLNRIENNWQKSSDDGSASVAIPTDTLTDYTSLARRRDILWEKLKVSFVWPTVAKFKNAKISELSVPDSIKEVFQPGFVTGSNVDDSDEQTFQQLAQSRPLVSKGPIERAQISAPPHRPPCPQTNRATCTAPAQRGEKFVDTEKSESATTTSATVAEVERLRKHLISIEQAYTNELLQCEEEIEILRNELKSKEEQLNSIAESYTSTNLSTNKTIEQMQREIKHLSDDKMQLTAQLCRCQNDFEKSLIDTRNLRSALDLFYKNKDSEIVQATEKLNNRIRRLQSDNERLRETLASLRNDLDASQQIFSKNQTLIEELKIKQDQIDALNMKVGELTQQRFQNTDEGERSFKVVTTASDVEAKMRLYVTSDSPTTKSQSLRILADVLEFSDGEKLKIGITERTGEKTKNNRSLIDEFIRFVEKESHPRTSQADAETRYQQVREAEYLPTLQMRKNISATYSPDLSTVDVVPTPNTSINLPGHDLTRTNTSSSILLKDALNSNDI